MSDCSAIARSAIAVTAAIFIASLICVAPTSSAPRKMKGKHRTLLTWFGKSERPVAMTASGRTCLARSGRISGSGLASARINGCFAIRLTISGLSTPPAESPRKMSAPSMMSPSVRAEVCRA
jgi:hypothetical protein